MRNYTKQWVSWSGRWPGSLFQILLYKSVPKPAMTCFCGWCIVSISLDFPGVFICTTFFTFKTSTAIDMATWRLFSYCLVQEWSFHHDQLPWRAIIFCRSYLSAHLTCLSAQFIHFQLKPALSRDHQNQGLDYLKGIWNKCIEKIQRNNEIHLETQELFEIEWAWECLLKRLRKLASEVKQFLRY